MMHGAVWGLRESGRHLRYFNLVSESDVIVFYVTRPISGVVGFGKVTGKTRADSPLWPDENATGRVIWPLRINFEVGGIIPRHMWNTARIELISIRKKAQGGFQPMLDSLADYVVTQLESVV